MMGDGFGMGWGWLFGLLFLVGLGLLIVLAVRALGGGIRRDTPAHNAPLDISSSPQPTRGSARQILDERYARGELTTEEYRERLQALGGDT